MKLEIPVKADFDNIQDMVDEIKKLQTYKLFEGDDMVLVNLDAVVAVMTNHVRTDKCSESPSDWIPCTPETMPEEGERVLCTHLGGIDPNRQVIEHIYEDGKFVLGWNMDMNPSSPTFGQRYMGNVIAWMPLPKPYKEEEE